MSKTIALTIGDPNGIGHEIAVKAAAALLGNDDIRVVLIGDEHVIRHHGELCAPTHEFRYFQSGAPSRDTILLHPVDALSVAHFRP
jgi:4-hydroxythreonine-4-phosphate dehydrogenase